MIEASSVPEAGGMTPERMRQMIEAQEAAATAGIRHALSILPPLSGTEKQVAWATKLRAANCVPSRTDGPPHQHSNKQDIDAWQAIAVHYPPARNAAWWIDVGRFFLPWHLFDDDRAGRKAQAEFDKMLAVPDLTAILELWKESHNLESDDAAP